MSFNPEMKQWFRNPEASARAHVLLELKQKGLDTSDCVGFHSTSIEALEYYLHFGKMAGFTGEVHDKPIFPRRGDLYFYPFKDAIPKLECNPDYDIKEEVLKSAQNIAQELGQVHRLCSLLHLPPINSSDYYLGMLEALSISQTYSPTPGTEEFDLYQKFLSQRSKDETERLIANAKQAQGIILGVSRNILAYGIPRTGDDNYDLRIDTNVIPFSETFSGLLPMGPLEEGFFASLDLIT